MNDGKFIKYNNPNNLSIIIGKNGYIGLFDENTSNYLYTLNNS